jgi:hypothetical protein
MRPRVWGWSFIAPRVVGIAFSHVTPFHVAPPSSPDTRLVSCDSSGNTRDLGVLETPLEASFISTVRVRLMEPPNGKSTAS